MIYQNTASIADKGSTLTPRDFSTPFVVGRQGGANNEYWQGDIAELLVYDRELSADELARFQAGGRQFQGSAVFDGQRFMVLTFPPGATLWDVATARHVATIRPPEGVSLRTMAATPDGELAITGDTDQRIRVWNARNGRLLRTLTGHGGAVQILAVSPDGRTLASFAEDFLVKLWSLPTGRELMTMSRTLGFGRLLFTPDGEGLAGTHPWVGTSVWRVNSEPE